jgi:hypothetical protein
VPCAEGSRLRGWRRAACPVRKAVGGGGGCAENDSRQRWHVTRRSRSDGAVSGFFLQLKIKQSPTATKHDDELLLMEQVTETRKYETTHPITPKATRYMDIQPMVTTHSETRFKDELKHMSL